MTSYVVGFVFSTNRKSVALIRKTKPEWQAGKLNGVGGHVEAGEQSITAMVREFREETGIVVPEDQWTRFATMVGKDYVCNCFKAFTDTVFSVKTCTEEPVGVYAVDTLTNQTSIHNIAWLVHLALDEQTPHQLIAY